MARLVFQFLIGTVQQEQKKLLKKFCEENMFQFLIGTVQQNMIKKWIKKDNKFQFLIGTVQQQYLCGLSNTLFQNIVYNMLKSRSIYFLENPKTA